MKRLIVGIGHQREVGKDLMGTMLHGHLAREFKKIKIVKTAFAKPIYDVAKQMYGWAGMQDKAYYDLNKEDKEKPLKALTAPDGKVITPRQILIHIGNKMRDLYPLTWVEHVLRTDGNIIIITDLRFPNEFQLIRDYGGLCVKIRRPIMHNEDPLDPDNQLRTGVDWDHIIDNSKSKQVFEQSIKNFVEEHRKKFESVLGG